MKDIKIIVKNKEISVSKIIKSIFGIKSPSNLFK